MLTTKILCLMTAADVVAKMQALRASKRDYKSNRWLSAPQLLCKDRMMFAVSLLVVVGSKCIIMEEIVLIFFVEFWRVPHFLARSLSASSLQIEHNMTYRVHLHHQ